MIPTMRPGNVSQKYVPSQRSFVLVTVSVHTLLIQCGCCWRLEPNANVAQ